jgi:hypothetical protein
MKSRSSIIRRWPIYPSEVEPDLGFFITARIYPELPHPIWLEGWANAAISITCSSRFEREEEVVPLKISEAARGSSRGACNETYHVNALSALVELKCLETNIQGQRYVM